MSESIQTTITDVASGYFKDALLISLTPESRVLTKIIVY